MHGLTEQEAQKKLKEFGFNEIPQAPPVAWWKIFLGQLKNFLILVLLASAAISLFVGELKNTFFITLIVVLNSALGAYQEFKAQKDLRSLKTMVKPVCRVLRDGGERLIETRDVVPKDLVVLGEGDKVPADGVLVEGTRLLVNEAVLTGESRPQEKLKNGEMLYMATSVLSGHGILQVETTGVNTRFGKIALGLSKISDEKTPLEEKLDFLGRRLGFFILTAAIFLFFLGILQGRSVYNLFLQVAALAVAAIPEGLPAVFTITMALGMQRMAKQKAIVRKLSATEGLGSTNIICTDKTGTLTKNEMTVRKVWVVNSREYVVTGVGYSGHGVILGSDSDSRIDSGQARMTKKKTIEINKDSKLQKLIEIGVLCNSSSLILKEDGGSEFDILGDTTEGALLILAKKAGVDIDKVKEEWKIVEEPPFDQELMTTSVVVAQKGERDKLLLLVKGAPEKLIELCQINQAEKEEALKKLADYGGQGLRVLAVAYKTLDTKGEFKSLKSLKEKEKDLTFVGLVGIDDPPREEVKEMINTAQKAGIRTVMLTGDNPLTALRIAEEVGLVEKGSEVVTGEQLNLYNEQVFNDKLDKVNVFARVTPEDKLKIVEMLQKRGLVVTVTGDGVNDAPALKKADIGVAMGITGTDVAKEAADIVIMDDNYATIVKAIEEGRVIYDNITKAVKYLLISNFGESLTVVLALVLGWVLPLLPAQILWINLVTDGLPAIAMAVDPKDPLVMVQKSRGRTSGFLSAKDWLGLGAVGFFQALVALFLFSLALRFWDLSSARLVTFTTLVVMELVLAFIIRGGRQKLWGNKTLLFAVGVGIFCQILILTVPFLRNIFS